MTIRREDGRFGFFDKDGKDFSKELSVTSLSIDADSEKTKCILITVNPNIDMKIDEIEIKFDIHNYIKGIGIQDLKALKTILTNRIKEIDIYQE